MPHPQSAVDRDDRPGDVAAASLARNVNDAGDLLRRRRTGRAAPAPGSPLPLLGQRRRSCRWSTKPGATTFAVMSRLPSSRAIERASPTRPALLAA